MAGVDTSFYATQPTNKLQSPMDAMKDVMPIALGQQALSHDQFKQAQEQINASNQLFGSIAANPTLETVASVAGQLKQMNVPDAMIQQGLQEFTKNGDDPKYIQSIALNHIQRHGTVLEQMQAGGMAPPTLTPTGNQLIPTQTRSGLNPSITRAGGPAIPMEMGPTERVTPDLGVAPDGTPIAIPRGSRFSPTGQPLAAPPVAVGAGSPAGAMPVAASPAALPGALAAGLAPGQREAKTAVGGGSGDQLKTDLLASGNYRREVYPLEQAIPALEKLGTTGTGPGKDEFNHIKSLLLSSGLPGIDEDKVATFDKAKKYLTDYVNQTGNTGTNDKLAAAFAGNPSVGISNAGATEVAKAALALRRLRQAQTLAFAQSGQPEGDYSRWAATFNNSQDPRAYGYDLMSKDKQDKLIKSLGPSDTPTYKKFMTSLRTAHQVEVLNPQRPE